MGLDAGDLACGGYGTEISNVIGVGKILADVCFIYEVESTNIEKDEQILK